MGGGRPDRPDPRKNADAFDKASPIKEFFCYTAYLQPKYFTLQIVRFNAKSWMMTIVIVLTKTYKNTPQKLSYDPRNVAS